MNKSVSIIKDMTDVKKQNVIIDENAAQDEEKN